MQLYVLDRAKNTLATTSSFYSDKHHKELTAGASIFEFTIDKSDSAAQHMTTGNYLVFQDDRGRAWSFTILSYDETQTTKTVAAEDVSIELLNKAMDVWNTDQAYPFSYYFDLITKGTPWKLGVNQLTDLSRKLVYTGRDTGLGRLLSILKGFDNAECQFNIKVKQNSPVEFTVDVYKSIGTMQDNIQIVYNNELADIKKTESRAQFVTALAGIGGLVENQATTDPGLEKHIDFTDIDYKDDNFVSPKGDKFLRAVTANRTFNPGTTTYIEDFYDYDTQSAQELLNRTLTQLKERSEPQYTYDADVKVIDPTLDIGDTVTIIDHDYNPALYLQARVATLDKSYTDPTQGAITFCNYRVLNSNLSDQLRAMQNIIDQLPTSASIKVINNNIVQMIAQNDELKKQVALSFESANGKSRVWFSKSATAQDGDVAFIKNADGATEIWKFVEGAWKLDTGLATFDDVKKAASAAADAGSQAVVAGSQASAAGADAKSAGDFAASAASQSAIETAAARSTANSAADAASDAVTAAFGAGTTADQAKSAAAAAKADAASAQSDAADALAEATKSFNDAQNAISNATKAMDAAEQNRTTVTGLTTKVDDIAGTIQTLATTQSVDKLAGTVTTVQNLAQFAADGLKLKADSSTVSSLDGRVTKLSGQLDVQADKIAATVTASDVTGMLGNYATQSWSQGQISAAKNEISASVETVQNQVNNMQIGGVNLLLDTEFNDLPQYWTSRAGKVTGTFNGHNIIYCDATAITGNAAYVLQQPIYNPAADNRTLPNQWYTLSFYVKGSGQMTSYVYGSFVDASAGSYIDGVKLGYANRDGSRVWDLTDTWVWHVYTFKSRANFPDGEVQNVLFSAFKGNKVYIAMPKLEKGTISTDYSPAPEDMATIDWTKSLLDVSEGKVSAQVQSVKTDLTNATNTLNNNIANATAGMATQTWVNNKVSLTEDGLTADIQKLRTDTTGNIANATAGMATQTWTQSKLDLTADGLTSQISSVENGLDTKYTSLEETLKGVQITANNAVTQSQYTQLAGQITSVVKDVAPIKNLFPDPTFDKGGLLPTADGTGWTIKYDNTNLWILNSSGAVQRVYWPGFGHVGGSYSVKMLYNSAIGGPIRVGFAPVNDADMGTQYSFSAVDSDTHWVEFTVNCTVNTAFCIWLQNAQPFRVHELYIFNSATGVATSQITQLQSDINLRVKTGDLINQINVSTEGILIDGSKTQITGDTYIEMGVIKTAQIADAAITNGKIANAAIDNAKIANAAITAAKIADLAVGSAQIADGAISSAKIGNASITSAKIADASIIDAKIVNLDGSKIVANSITADKLDVNAIAVGLNQYGAGWRITPASIAFLPNTAITKASLMIDGTGITFSDITNGETLAMLQGTPYNTAKDTWYNGMLLDLSPNNDYVAMVDESAAAKTKFAWSRSDKADFGIFSGFNFYDHVHFNTIGPFDYDTHARLRCVRIEISGRWATGFMNLGTVKDDAGIAFTDDGATFICRASKWYNLVDIVNKIGIA